MRRTHAITVARDSRVLIRIFNVVLAALAFSALVASFPVQTRAQTPETGCGEGLIRRVPASGRVSGAGATVRAGHAPIDA